MALDPGCIPARESAGESASGAVSPAGGAGRPGSPRRHRIRRGWLAAAFAVVLANAAAQEPGASYEEQALVRHWREPFQPLPYDGAYVSLIQRPTDTGARAELWHNTWSESGAAEQAIVVRRGPSLERLGEPLEVANGLLIDDVFEPGTPDTLAPNRGFTRPHVAWYDDLGYVMLACVCPDYRPGTVDLLPAILTSPTGEPGTWTYRGIVRGDVSAGVAGRRIWSDGGALIRLPDGGWRIYLNGFGTVVALLESSGLDGPWRFRRDEAAEIRELVPMFPRAAGRGGCFPIVLRVAADDWHLWLTDAWPPQAIFHYWSADGLEWREYGEQPEITRLGIGAPGIKCLRPSLSPDGRSVVGLLSVWQPAGDGGEFVWQLHRSTLPVGPPPGRSDVPRPLPLRTGTSPRQPRRGGRARS